MIVQPHTPAPLPGRCRSERWTCQRGEGAVLAGPPRALVADDDPEMRALVRDALRRAGYEVLEASDGRELAMLVQSEVLQATMGLSAAIIVTDVVMPGRTGLDVVSWLRSHDWATPVVLLTGFGSAEVHEDARRLGAAIMDKPFELDALQRLVQSLVRR